MTIAVCIFLFTTDVAPIFLRTAQAAEASVDMTAVDRIAYYRRFLKLPTASEDSAMTARATEEAQSQLQSIKASGAAGGGTQDSEPLVRVTSKSGVMNPTTTLAISTITGTMTGGDVIDRMMALPFTALKVIDPQLARVGFGLQCDAGVCAAVMAVRRGLDKSTRLELYQATDADRYWNPNLGPVPPTPAQLNTPVEFPPDGGLAPELSYSGSDWPAPLSACPGYSTPTGPPIILQLGKGASNDGPDVSAHTLTHDGQDVTHCLIAQTSLGSDADSSHSNPIWQYLNAFGAVIIIPREPFAPSSTYSVSITADSNNNSWSFRTPAK
jgi:hypothetical protein